MLRKFLATIIIIAGLSQNAFAIGPAVGNVQIGPIQAPGVSSIAITIPTDATTSTIMIYEIALANSTINPTVTWPAGFTQIRSDSMTLMTQAWAWKVYAPGDGTPGTTTLTASWNNGTNYYSQGAIWTISNVDLVNPIIPASVGQTGTSTSVIAPSITTSVDSQLVVSCFALDNGITLGLPNTTLYNLALHGTGCSYYTKALAGATGTQTASSSTSNAWAGAQVAFQVPTILPTAGDYAMAERGMFFDDFDLIPSEPSTWFSNNVKVTNAEIR